VNWSEGSSYLLPASKGIACGWIHKSDNTDTDNNDAASTANEKNEDDTAQAEKQPTDSSAITTSQTTSDVKDMIVYVLKVSPETLDSMNKSKPDDLPCWVQKSYELFQQCLSTEKIKAEQPNDIKQNDSTTDDGVEKNELEGIKLSNDESLSMNLIIELALDDPFFGWNSHMPDR